MREGRGSVVRIHAADLRQRVIQLRRERHTFAEIGRELGTSTTRAYNIYRQALALIPAADIEEHRAESLQLIDDQQQMLISVIERTKITAPRTATESSRVMSVWEERKARLLGLDMPTRTEHRIISAEETEYSIRELERQVGEKRAAAIPEPPLAAIEPPPVPVIAAAIETAADDDVVEADVVADVDEPEPEPEQPYRLPDRGTPPPPPREERQEDKVAEDWAEAYRPPQPPQPEFTEPVPGWRQSVRRTLWD